jgi:CBS domain containing-hemolysin-like protein
MVGLFDVVLALVVLSAFSVGATLAAVLYGRRRKKQQSLAELRERG